MRCGRYFVHEHPRSATSWEDPYIKALRNDPRTVLAEADLCQFGLMSRDKDGESFAKKPTTFLTNSLEMQKSLSKNQEVSDNFQRFIQMMFEDTEQEQVYTNFITQNPEVHQYYMGLAIQYNYFGE